MESKEMINLNEKQLQVRDIGTITFEIVSLKEQAVNAAMFYYIEIGKRLTEAKALVPHGEWGKWLEEKVDFEKTTANNFMKIYEEYGNSPNLQAFGNLGYSKLVMLLPLLREERKEFVQNNDVENMSTRELNKALKERDEALKKAEKVDELKKQLSDSEAKVREFESKANALASKSLSLQTKLDKANDINKKHEAQIEDLKKNPVVSDDVINGIKDKLKVEAKKELESEISKNNEALNTALQEKKDAENKVNELKAKISEMEKAVKLSNPDVVEFKTLFDLVQKNLKELVLVLEKIKATDKQKADKLRSALVALFEGVVK